MARYAFQILISALEGRDDELNAWLDNHHIPEVLKTEGFVSAQRYGLAPGETGKPQRYMHIYQIETDDLEKTKEAMRLDGAKRTPLSTAIDTSTISMTYYKLRGPEFVGGSW